jgi:predicted Rossmann-fold nucleotide-binding protein
MGTAYWGGLLSWLRETAAAAGTITLGDIDLLHVTDDVDEAVRIIVNGDSNMAAKRPE